MPTRLSVCLTQWNQKREVSRVTPKLSRPAATLGSTPGALSPLSVDPRLPRAPSQCLQGSLQARAGSPKGRPSRIECSGSAGQEWDHTGWMTGPRVPQVDPQERLLSLPLSACPDPWAAAAASPNLGGTHLGLLQPKLCMSPHPTPWRLRRAWPRGGPRVWLQPPAKWPLRGQNSQDHHWCERKGRVSRSVVGGVGGVLRVVSQADLSWAPGPAPLPPIASWAQENPLP